MKKIWILALVSVVGLNAKATIRPHSFIDLLDKDPEMVVSGKGTKRDCVDFSGNWKGTCKVKEQTLEESLTVQQKECQLLVITGHEGKVIKLPIGGVVNSTVTVPGEPGFTGSGTLTSHWNAEHTALQVIVGKTGKKLAVDRPTRGMMVNQHIKLVDGKLTTEFTAYYQKEKTTGSCEFTKQ